MTEESGYGGEKSAKTMAVIGLCGSLLSLIFMAFNYFYIPMGILFLVAYTFALFGIIKRKSWMLFFAQILICINIVIHILISVTYFVIGIVLPQSILEDGRKRMPSESEEEAKIFARIAYFILAFLVLLIVLYNIFAVFVFQKFRLNFLRTFSFNASSNPLSNESNLNSLNSEISTIQEKSILPIGFHNFSQNSLSYPTVCKTHSRQFFVNQ